MKRAIFFQFFEEFQWENLILYGKWKEVSTKLPHKTGYELDFRNLRLKKPLFRRFIQF